MQGVVYQARYQSADVATKVFNSDCEMPEEEIFCLRILSHCRSVLQIKDWLPDATIELPEPILPSDQELTNVKCLVTELCREDLFDVVAANKGFKDASLLKALLRQVLCAVAATHEAGLCHLDIKAENFLVAQDYTLRLCDFGFAQSTESLNGGRLGT